MHWVSRKTGQSRWSRILSWWEMHACMPTGVWPANTTCQQHGSRWTALLLLCSASPASSGVLSFFLVPRTSLPLLPPHWPPATNSFLPLLSSRLLLSPIDSIWRLLSTTLSAVSSVQSSGLPIHHHHLHHHCPYPVSDSPPPLQVRRAVTIATTMAASSRKGPC